MTYVLSSKRAGAVAAALAILVLSGCMSEMPRQLPTEPDPYRNSPFPPSYVPVLSTPRLSAQGVAMSNSVRYRDEGIRVARGRAGAASMQLRALAGMDGQTIIEATTGSFDGSPSLDRFEKVTLRIPSAGIGPVNEWPDLPEWSYHLAGLAPRDTVNLQANIRVNGFARVQVVSATTVVARRPDLAVLAVNGAAQGYPGTAITFFAPVTELNGDVGARANCTLFVNDHPVDQATGIWVDAGGAVSCQFSYSFENTGTYTVAVKALNVNPGDWNLENNTASTSVTILAPGTPIAYGQVSVEDQSYVYENRTTRTGQYPIDAVSGGSQQLSQVNFYGTATEPIPAPIARVEAQVSAGGTTIYQSTLTQLYSYSYQSGGATVTCIDYAVAGQTAQSCTTAYPNGVGSAWYSYAHSSGTVTYYGNTLYCGTFGCNTYTNNGSTVTGWGSRYGLGAGSTVRVRLSFVDAGGEARVVDRNVTLQDLSGPVNYDRSGCYEYYDGLGQVCYRQVSSGTVWRGLTSW